METGPWRLSVLLSGVLVLTLHVHLLLGDAGTDMDTGPTLQESAFQGIESVRQVQCIADRENIIFVNLLGDNETVLISARFTKDGAECKPRALLSKCDFGPGNKIRLQVLVTDVSKAVGLRCCLQYTGIKDVRTTCSATINITIPEKTILTTSDVDRDGMVSTKSSVGNRKTGATSNVFDEGTSKIVTIVVCTLLVIFVALFIILLCVLIRVRKRKKTAGPRDFELLSFRRSFGGESSDREGRALKRIASCPPPSGLPPDVMMMPYQAPLPLSAGGIPYMEDRGHVSGSVGQYQEPWRHPTGEISNGLTTFRPNPRVAYVPGFEGTVTRENMAALLEDGP